MRVKTSTWICFVGVASLWGCTAKPAGNGDDNDTESDFGSVDGDGDTDTDTDTGMDTAADGDADGDVDANVYHNFLLGRDGVYTQVTPRPLRK